MLARHGIRGHPATVKNPQANSVIERVHRTMGDIIRTFVKTDPLPLYLQNVNDMIDTCLATVIHACRTASSKALNNISPGALVFQRDMLLDIPIIADILTITQNRQITVNQNLINANNKRIEHNYQPGQRVLLKATQPKKLETKWLGPFVIVSVHVNGTVVIQRQPNVEERINIRRLKPFRE